MRTLSIEAGWLAVVLMNSGCDTGAESSRKRDSVNEGTEKACANMTRAVLVNVAMCLDVFKLDHGRYPDTLDDLKVVPKYVNTEKYPPDGYLRELPTDGWDNNIVYKRGSSSARPFELKSYGSDGREGGEGFDADITY